MFSVTSTLNLGTLSKLAESLPDEAQRVCDKTALSIEHDAKESAAVDTGFMRRSVYSVTSKGSDYGGGDGALPKVDRPPGISAAVGVAASYAWFVDRGTHKMAAQPFFTPAVERHRQRFVDDLKEALT